LHPRRRPDLSMAQSVVFALGMLMTVLSPLMATGEEARPALAKMDTALRAMLDAASQGQLNGGRGTTRSNTARVMVEATDLQAVEQLVTVLGGRTGRRLSGNRSVVAEIPVARLEALAGASFVRTIRIDRPIAATVDPTASSIGARWVNDALGFDGNGIGVAIIDSGVTGTHDDLGGNRVVHFVDFVDLQPQPHDGYGHGTHVAGVIAGSGYDSGGARRGIAPGAHLVVLKTLNDDGEGFISNAIAAIDYAIELRAAYNIRVINLSVAAGVYESYKTDPLTLAAARAVEAGIVVVTAAGNQGRDAKGRAQYGGITSPGNAPWVLTVGASNHNGTLDRRDDTIAPFSSLGPSRIDFVAKPDLVAPGVGIESLADTSGTLFAARPEARLWGSVATTVEPYLSLSGTSMAAPVVAGTVALMLEANPALKPAAVKAILQRSAEPHPAYSVMAQGAGFLNARASVELAQTYAANPDGAERLESLVEAYGASETAATAMCDDAAGDCRGTDLMRAWMQAACTAAPDCAALLSGMNAGGKHAPVETIVWSVRTRRPTRRTPRTAKMKERLRPTRAVEGQETNGNAGVAE
jgi:subtilisin family serine protease